MKNNQKTLNIAAAVLATAACKALLHVPALKPHVQAG